MKHRRKQQFLAEVLESRTLFSTTLQLVGVQSLHTAPVSTLATSPPVGAYQAEMYTAIDPANPANVAVFDTSVSPTFGPALVQLSVIFGQKPLNQGGHIHIASPTAKLRPLQIALVAA
jgi:hypothetical protein